MKAATGRTVVFPAALGSPVGAKVAGAEWSGPPQMLEARAWIDPASYPASIGDMADIRASMLVEYSQGGALLEETVPIGFRSGAVLVRPGAYMRASLRLDTAASQTFGDLRVAVTITPAETTEIEAPDQLITLGSLGVTVVTIPLFASLLVARGPTACVFTVQDPNSATLYAETPPIRTDTPMTVSREAFYLQITNLAAAVAYFTVRYRSR